MDIVDSLRVLLVLWKVVGLNLGSNYFREKRLKDLGKQSPFARAATETKALALNCCKLFNHYEIL